MTQKALWSRAFGLFLVSLVLATLSAEPIIEIPDEGEAGGYLTVTLDGIEGSTVLRAELQNEENSLVSSNVVFAIPGSTSGRRAAVLGIPADIEAGFYTVALVGINAELIARKQFYISQREFSAETIELSSPMSELRQTDDPRRLRESRTLWQLLNIRNASGLYHFGSFREPLYESVRTSSFGDRRVFVYTDGGTDGSTHSGVDLVAPPGTVVLSSGNGMVVFSGERLITGNTIVIEHLPGLYSLYYHLAELRTVEGEHVGAGQAIGVIGATGLVTGIHLHWEFRIGGIPVDPDNMSSFGL